MLKIDKHWLIINFCFQRWVIFLSISHMTVLRKERNSLSQVGKLCVVYACIVILVYYVFFTFSFVMWQLEMSFRWVCIPNNPFFSILTIYTVYTYVYITCHTKFFCLTNVLFVWINFVQHNQGVIDYFAFSFSFIKSHVYNCSSQ